MAAIGEIIEQSRPLAKVSRIIETGKRGQAIMLTGPPGIGKFALGSWLALRYLCQKDASGCGQCWGCRQAKSFRHPDYLLAFPFPNLSIESRKNTLFHFSDPVNSDARYSDDSLDEVNRFLAEKANDTYRIISFEKKQNIPVEVIKDLIRAIGKRPMIGQRRVVMVCEVERMAFGAPDLFLKTVEEPPEDTLIILTSARPHALPPTLLSRTIRIPLEPVSDKGVGDYLLSAGIAEPNDFYLRYAAGSPGMALKAVEDELLSRRDELWKVIIDYIEKGNLPRIIETLRRQRFKSDFDDAKNDFALIHKILRDIYVAKIGLDKRIINTDINAEINRMAKIGPSPGALQAWMKSSAKAARVFEINNVSVDMALIGMFIEFDRARNMN